MRMLRSPGVMVATWRACHAPEFDLELKEIRKRDKAAPALPILTFLK
jgi:hypothetical protein